MATGSDALLDHLLFQIALSGDQGLGIKALSDAFIEFHAKTHIDDEVEEDADEGNVDILFSLKPPGSKSNAHSQACDPQHLEKLWTWLTEHSDVHVKPKVSQDATTDVAATFDVSNPLTPVLKAHADECLHTTENRIWHALTDHDVDWKRIPKLEFQCLQVIAAQGAGGILQPDVTRLTGQDKRSVPRRTASLAEKGYVTKELCLGGGIKTSLLRLKKFSQGIQQTSTYIEVKTEAGKKEQKGPTLRMVHYETWYNDVIAHLKKHGNIMAYEDLRKEMRIHGLKWETRALHRCMRRLDKAGCIQRIKARLDVENAGKDDQEDINSEQDEHQDDDEDADQEKSQEKSPKESRPQKKIRWVRCIKLMREPTQKDKDAFTSSAGVLGNERMVDDHDETDVEGEEDEFAEVDAAALAGSGKAPETARRIPSQWQPLMHHTQFIFNLVNSSGTKGLSSMDLADYGVGHFWRRPLDELIGRLTDVWTVSQPLHLRHIAIVRDTAFKDRTSHYVFRSFENYKKLVENGEAAWEAIGVEPSELVKEPELDVWGFPQVDSSAIFGHEGTANVASCKNMIVKPNLKRHIFDRKEANIYAPKGKSSSGRNVAPSTPRRASSAVQATPVGAATPRDDATSPPVNATPPTKQYKKNLWQMNPKRVEAELKEWKSRARRLAESKTRAEFGISSKAPKEPENSKPKKRRKGKANDIATEPARPSGVGEPAPFAVPGDATASEPTTPASIPPPDVNAVNNNILDNQPNEQPNVQPDEQPKSETGAQSGFQGRVSEIEQQILDKADPGVYINPPGSGQMKNSVFLPRGRPSKYLIAVFKSDKLENLPWFNKDNDIVKSALRAQGLYSSPQSALDQNTADAEEIPSGNQAVLGPDEKLIIRNGPRALKRKARESLRERVAKKLITESSFERPQQSSPVRKMPSTDNVDLMDTAPENPVESSSEAPSWMSANYVPSLPDNVQSRPSVMQHPTPTSSSSVLNVGLEKAAETVQEAPSATTAGYILAQLGVESKYSASRFTTEPKDDKTNASESSVEGVIGVQAKDDQLPVFQPNANQHSDTQALASQPLEQQVSAGAVDTDVHMEDASETETRAQPSHQPETYQSTEEAVISIPMDGEAQQMSPVKSPSAQKTLYPSILPSLNETPSQGYRPRTTKKVGVIRSGGNVSFNREKTALELIHKHGGMFGGDRELFYPFITVYEKEHNKRPDRHTLDRVLAVLVADGRLKRLSFTFQASNGTIANKSIVMEPGVDPDCPEIQELKQKIMNCYPVSYIPEDAELAPDLRKHVEADFRNIYSKRPLDAPTIKSYFPKDSSAFVSRLHNPRKVKLGMTEASLQSGISARRRRREEESRRQERYMKAQLEEDEIDEAQAALQGEIQLDSYEHDPKRAYIDRGPHGRGRLAKLQRWGAEEQEENQLPRRALGLLTANEQNQAEQNSRDAAAASSFGLLNLPKVYEIPAGLANRDRPDPSTGPPGTLSQVLQDVAGTFRVIEALSFTSPYQRFHSQSGTFSTDPVIITTSSKPSKFGFDGEQMPMSLADIFKQAGEEATLLEDPEKVSQQSLVAGQFYEAPKPMMLAGFGPKYPLMAPTPRPRKPGAMSSTRPSLPLPEYKPYHQRISAPRATRSGIFSMSDKEEQRLIYAVVAVRTLAGGLEQHTNWGLVHQVFHYKFDPNYCRHRWGLLRHKHAGTVEKLQVEFRKVFIEAYEQGEVPEIDFMEPEKYDWLSIVEWAESRLQTPLTDGLLELPRDRRALEMRYDVNKTTDVYNIMREDFWAAHVTHLRREDLANSWTYSRPFTKEPSAPSDDDDLLAKSWVRANVVTPDVMYDSNAAHRKLVQIEDRLPKALEQLLGAKIIRMENKGRTIPGRNYDISDQVLMVFKRQWDISFMRSTAAYKASIDEAFTRDGKIAINYHATDPQWTAMTNLVSNGRAKVVPVLPPINHTIGAPWPRLSKWGFTEGNYKTVHMDKSRLHFGLELHPTDSYVQGLPISLLPVPLSKQFPGERGPRLPLWTDINGDIIPVYWDMMLMATMWLLAFRPGLTAETMAKGAYKSKLWAWELDVFLEWAEASGLARRLDVEGCASPGWTAAEWWWLAFAENTEV